MQKDNNGNFNQDGIKRECKWCRKVLGNCLAVAPFSCIVPPVAFRGCFFFFFFFFFENYVLIIFLFYIRINIEFIYYIGQFDVLCKRSEAYT
jgi:hypothetical protein